MRLIKVRAELEKAAAEYEKTLRAPKSFYNVVKGLSTAGLAYAWLTVIYAEQATFSLKMALTLGVGLHVFSLYLSRDAK
jgi:hypothetical protein